MNRSLRLASLLPLATVASAAVADVDQSQTDVSGYIAGFGQAGLAQSFQPSVSNITGAGIYLEPGVTVPSAVTIALYSALPNAGGALLGTGSGAPGASGSWTDVSFGSAISVTPNASYVLVFTSTGNVGGVAGSTTNPYSRGQAYANTGYGSFPAFDYAFRTSYQAQPTPEPASFAALGVGVLGLLRRRKRA